MTRSNPLMSHLIKVGDSLVLVSDEQTALVIFRNLSGTGYVQSPATMNCPSHCAYLEMYERHCDLSFSEGSVMSLWQNGQIDPISTHTFGPRPTPAVGDDQ